MFEAPTRQPGVHAVDHICVQPSAVKSGEVWKLLSHNGVVAVSAPGECLVRHGAAVMLPGGFDEAASEIVAGCAGSAGEDVEVAAAEGQYVLVECLAGQAVLDGDEAAV